MPGDSSEADQFRQQRHAEEIASRRQTPAERQERNLEAMLQKMVDKMEDKILAKIQINGTGNAQVSGGNGVFSIDVQPTTISVTATCNNGSIDITASA